MFDVSAPLLFLDYFRVPSSVAPATVSGRPAGCHSARWRDEGGPTGGVLLWPDIGLLRGHAEPGSYQLHGAPLFVRLLPDALVRQVLRQDDARWGVREPVADATGRVVGAVWQDSEGNVFLPFSPDEVMEAFWSESYQAVAGSTSGLRARTTARRAYYRLRPALPRSVQITCRRLFSRLQARVAFPRWPVEPALHDFYAWFLDLLAELAQAPVPSMAPWPDGLSWALVLTHDVETAEGYAAVPGLCELETARGYRSCWNFVPQRYPVQEALVDELARTGFEVGVHGLHHDGRDLVRSQLPLRVPQMRSYADRWHASGFRSPATLREWDVMPSLGFDYDSSSPDTDPYEPQAGGCCTWLPFLHDGMVELPITLPQDHTLFVILQSPDGQIWRDKVEHLRRSGGMALLVTHPDYLLEEERLTAYRDLLERYAEDDTAWRVLPREVASWWRRRSASHLERSGGEWQVVGPAAAEGRVLLTLPGGSSRIDAVEEAR